MATGRVPTGPRHGSWPRTTVGRSTPCTQSGHGTLMAPSTIGYHSGMARGLGDMRTSAAREDTPTVTTSLQPTAPEPSRRRLSEPRFGESLEILPPANGGHGVPRSAWFRNRRLSTWHRPYAAALIVLDFIGVALANLTTVSRLGQATSGFQHQHTLFNAIAYLLLPLAWLVVLWGNGAYDRRYLGIGTDEFKRVTRTAVTLIATISLTAFLTKVAGDLSRFTVALSMLLGLVYVTSLRYAARRVLGLLRRQHRARRAAPARLAARRHRRRPGRRPATDRHRGPPGARTPGRGSPAAVRRGADPLRGQLAVQEPHGPGGRRPGPAAAVPGPGRHRAGDQAGRPGSGVLPAEPGRPGRQDVPGLEVPDDVRRRRGPARRPRGPERERRAVLQDP